MYPRASPAVSLMPKGAQEKFGILGISFSQGQEMLPDTIWYRATLWLYLDVENVGA